MRKWLRFGKAPDNSTSIGITGAIDSPPDHLICKSGAELLAEDSRKRMVVLIKRSVSVTPEVWDAHYLHALQQFAELVQEHPASRNHHHSDRGGLLDHTLEVTLRALRLSAGVILPPGAEPEDLLHNTERWRFGVFISALMHDVGKIIGDQETVFKDRNGKYVRWQPWHGPMPIGVPYIYRYRETKALHIHGLHEKLGITLLPFVLTPKASEWLTSDRQLLGQMMDTMAASATGAGVIGELVRKSDRSSAADNLSPDTGSHSASDKPLHAKILEALQTLANEGKLKRNLPGAAVWVTEDRTYIVAKSTMEKVRDHLLSQGLRSIPQSPLRLIQILNEHRLTYPPADGGDSQQAIVNDEKRSWKQKLSFIVLPNESIWVSGIPNTFTGTITPVDGEGKEVTLDAHMPRASSPTASPDQVVEETNTGGSVMDPSDTDAAYEQLSTAEPSTSASNPERDNHHDRGSLTDPLQPDHDQQLQYEQVASSHVTKQEAKTTDKGHAESQMTRENGVRLVSRNVSKKPAFKSKPGDRRSALKVQSEFFGWMLNGIKYRRIRVNESGAPVHIVGDFVALVSPKIFDLYLDDNKASASAYGLKRDRQVTQLQREVKSLNVHFRNAGEDFHKVIVRGPRRESSVSTLLIERKHFPELDRLSPNPILELAKDDHTGDSPCDR